MKAYIQIIIAGILLTAMSMPAYALSNPSTGDNSIVPLVVGIMAAAAVVLVVVLLLTRNKK